MSGEVYINPAQRKIGPLGLKLLWTRRISIQGALKVRDQIARMALDGTIKILVTRNYLAATFDGKEILALKNSEDYARVLARNGVAEIKFEKGTGSDPIGNVLDVMAKRGIKASRRILERDSIRVETQDGRQKIPEGIPDCLQIEIELFMNNWTLESFLKLKEPDEVKVLSVLELILKIFKGTRRLPHGFVPRLSPPLLLAIENAIIRNINDYKIIAPSFLEHPSASSRYLSCLIENKIVRDIHFAIKFMEREDLEIKQKVEIVLAVVENMVIRNPEPVFYFLELNFDKSPYRGSKHQEFVIDILRAMVNSEKLDGLKGEKIIELAESYSFPGEETNKLMVQMLNNHKIEGEEALEAAENEFVPASVVSDIISLYLQKTGERYEERREVIPAHEEKAWKLADDTGKLLLVNSKVDEQVKVHENRVLVYSKEDFKRAARIINKHLAEKQEVILKGLSKELAQGITAFLRGGK